MQPPKCGGLNVNRTCMNSGRDMIDAFACRVVYLRVSRASKMPLSVVCTESYEAEYSVCHSLGRSGDV